MAPSRGGSKAKPKKGANPLKAAAQFARQSGRHLDGAPESSRDLSKLISHHSTPPILTLLFPDATTQHRALSRLEAFYEDAKRGRRYLTLEEARSQRLCNNYEAFNLPVAVVGEWLGEMRKREVGHAEEQEKDGGADSKELMSDGARVGSEALDGVAEAVQSLDLAQPDAQADGVRPEPPSSSLTSAWYKPFCLSEEIYILDLLVSLGALELASEAPASATSPAARPPTYLISTVTCNGKVDEALAHERLHALYHLSPLYRSTTSSLYASLPSKIRSVVEHDLSLRGYSRDVWEDEFQAYASLDAGEFGNRARDECERVGKELRRAQKEAWAEVGLDGGG